MSKLIHSEYIVGDIKNIKNIRDMYNYMYSHGRIDLMILDTTYTGIPSLIIELSNMGAETKECRDLDLVRLDLISNLIEIYGS